MQMIGDAMISLVSLCAHCDNGKNSTVVFVAIVYLELPTLVDK